MMLMAFGFNCSLPSPDGPYTEKRTLATQEEEYWQHVQKDQARRAARGSARKDPKPGRVRPKDWTTVYVEDPDGYDDLDISVRERIMPRGETEARQAKTPGSPLHNGLGRRAATSETSEPESAAGVAEAMARDGSSRGTVVEVNSGLCRVALSGRMLLCNLRSSLRTPHSGFSNVLAAGDEVVVSYMTVSHNGHARGLVESVLPRRSALARPDVFYSHLQQVIVANVDQVLIVAAWREPAFWPELVDRYLIAAARYNLAPIICVNKIDLAGEAAEDPAELARTLDAYQQTGYRILATSARTGAGLAALREALAGRTTALAGLSGVGKSSLLSAAEPGLHLRTAEVSDRRHEGRHTTTQVTLHPLAAGGFVADTPGIREFGLSGLKGGDLPPFYPEIAAAAAGCAYADCSHTREPGCAVKAAVRAGRIAAMRYDSYRKIRHGLPE
jgi:ribosome biogenesis GTPase